MLGKEAHHVEGSDLEDVLFSPELMKAVEKAGHGDIDDAGVAVTIENDEGQVLPLEVVLGNVRSTGRYFSYCVSRETKVSMMLVKPCTLSLKGSMHYFRNSCGMYISRLLGILVLCLGFNLYSEAQAQPVTDAMKAPQLVQVQFVDRVYFREKTLLEMMNHPMDAPLQPQLLTETSKLWK